MAMPRNSGLGAANFATLNFLECDITTLLPVSWNPMTDMLNILASCATGYVQLNTHDTGSGGLRTMTERRERVICPLTYAALAVF
jgi:hypothetical protein